MALTKLNARSASALDATILTGNLPAISGASLTTLNATNISSGTLNAARYTAGGITEATIWRVTTPFTGNAAPIASNWEVDDTYANGLIGSGMTESSGVFTFPGTGYWLVMLHMSHFGGDSDNQYITCIVEYSSNSGSSWAEAVRTYSSTGDANEYQNSSVHKIFDITNTSTQKVRMNTTSQDANAHTMGDTSESATWVTFIKLADT